MMAYDKKAWARLAARLRRALRLAPPTPEEADAEMANAKQIPIGDDEIERIVDRAINQGDG